MGKIEPRGGESDRSALLKANRRHQAKFGDITISYILLFCFHIGEIRGWTSIVTLIFMATGANIVATSIVGEYVVRIYFQTKARPLFIVDRVDERTDAAPPGDPPQQTVDGEP